MAFRLRGALTTEKSGQVVPRLKMGAKVQQVIRRKGATAFGLEGLCRNVPPNDSNSPTPQQRQDCFIG